MGMPQLYFPGVTNADELFVAVRCACFFHWQMLGCFVESMNDMLIACVKACGGSKAVGPLLWPDKSVDSAQRLLLDCLNEDRPQHLPPDAVLFIMRMARERGVHDGMVFLSDRLGYSAPVPVQPEDKVAELQRKFIVAQQAMAVMWAEMQAASERIGQPVGVLRAVRS